MSPQVKGAWLEETAALRALLRTCGLVEVRKWSKPCFTFEGRNVAIIQPFKAHCALMFFQGALLRDSAGLLRAQGPNSHAARRLEFTSVAQVEAAAPHLRDLVRQAIRLEQAGVKVEAPPRRELELPAELLAAFKRAPRLAAAFRALTPGRRRGYVLHIAGAKQAATRAARVEKCAPRILAGKGLADR
jgi:uncharacterized protein YdeI (YjbR/CyaY-like superfamily)